MKRRSKKILRFFGLSAWFLILFLLFTWLTFPWGQLAERLVVTAADRGISLQIERLRVGMSSVRTGGLSLGSLTDDGTRSEWLALEAAQLALPEASFISGGLAGQKAFSGTDAGEPGGLFRKLITALQRINLDAELYQGKLSFELGADEEAARIELKADNLDLTQYTLRTGAVEAKPSSGRLGSEADVTWHWQDPKKSSGKVDLVLDNLVVSGLKVMGYALPEAAFDRSEAHLKISRGRAEFRDTALESSEIQAAVEGYIQLNAQPSRSRLALRLKFKVRDDLDSLLKVKFGSKPRHKDDKGWYHYQVNGTLSKPRFRESRAAARRARSRGSRTSGNQAKKENPKEAASVRQKESKPDDEELEKEDPVDEQRRQELEEERQRLREERARRREERREKREALIGKRNKRQADLNEDGSVEPAEGTEGIDEAPGEDEEVSEEGSEEEEGQGETEGEEQDSQEEAEGEDQDALEEAEGEGQNAQGEAGDEDEE